MRITITLFITLLLFVGCGSKKTESKNNSQTSKTLTKNEQLQAASVKLIKAFGSDLKSTLMSAMKEGSFSNAVSVCQEKAPAIAEKYSSNGWSIKRVTDKNRRAANKANEHETDILKLFADTTKPLKFFDEWVTSDNDSSYYFYKPIYINKFCLKCHGQADNISTEVKTVLQEKYPSDNAFDYKDGDLRGMFVVEVKAPEGLKHLNEIPADSL